jgi:hypothetical protein
MALIVSVQCVGYTLNAFSGDVVNNGTKYISII